MSGRSPRSTGRIFAVPALIAVSTSIGLGMALLGDGWADVPSWVGLGVPVATALHFAIGKGKRGA